MTNEMNNGQENNMNNGANQEDNKQYPTFREYARGVKAKFKQKHPLGYKIAVGAGILGGMAISAAIGYSKGKQSCESTGMPTGIDVNTNSSPDVFNDNGFYNSYIPDSNISSEMTVPDEDVMFGDSDTIVNE